MKTFAVTFRRHGGSVNRIITKDIQAVSTDEVWAIVDHWNENSDVYFSEILEIKEVTK